MRSMKQINLFVNVELFLYKLLKVKSLQIRYWLGWDGIIIGTKIIFNLIPKYRIDNQKHYNRIE